jgi:HTH-type transcriptional regulator/antitoxin HigA
MNITHTDYRTPGQYLAALLEDRGLSQRLLAVVLGLNETGINRLVADKRPLTADLALSLEEVFGVPAENFLELQKSYDLAKARISVQPDQGRATRAKLFGGLPVAEMIKRRWLEVDDIRDVSKVEDAMTKFFGVNSLNEIEILPHAAKKTLVNMPVSPAQLAWLYRVKAIASDMLVGKYSQSSVLGAIEKSKSLLTAPEEARHVPRILAEAGIRFVIVESLPASKIDGVCFWLDSRSPVIGLSMRYDRIDNFWFVLRHELEHVLHLHGQTSAVLDTELEGDRAGTGQDVSDEERIANAAAADFCVPSGKIDSFIARKSPLFSQRDLLGLARTLNVHPGLVAGQLQHKTARYDLFRNHLVKIRSAIAPSAIVDGWGDIAPVGI